MNIYLVLVYNPPVPNILKLRSPIHALKRDVYTGDCHLCERDEMINENELTKLLMASIEIEMGIPQYQLGVANLVVRRIAPRVLEIIKEEVRTARREYALKIQKNGD